MSNQDTQILAFNRGVLDGIGLARIDLERGQVADLAEHVVQLVGAASPKCR